MSDSERKPGAGRLSTKEFVHRIQNGLEIPYAAFTLDRCDIALKVLYNIPLHRSKVVVYALHMPDNKMYLEVVAQERPAIGRQRRKFSTPPFNRHGLASLHSFLSLSQPTSSQKPKKVLMCICLQDDAATLDLHMGKLAVKDQA